MRHHVAAADVEIDGEVLQRLDLYDDQVVAAGNTERRSAGGSTQRRALGEPFERVLHVRIGRVGAPPCRPRVIPRVVRVITERSELFHNGAVAEHLSERRRREHARRRDHHPADREDRRRRTGHRRPHERRHPGRPPQCHPGGDPDGERPVGNQPDEVRREQRPHRSPDLSGLMRAEQRRRRQHVAEEPVVDDVGEDQQRSEEADEEQHPRS